MAESYLAGWFPFSSIPSSSTAFIISKTFGIRIVVSWSRPRLSASAANFENPSFQKFHRSMLSGVIPAAHSVPGSSAEPRPRCILPLSSCPGRWDLRNRESTRWPPTPGIHRRTLDCRFVESVSELPDGEIRPRGKARLGQASNEWVQILPPCKLPRQLFTGVRWIYSRISCHWKHRQACWFITDPFFSHAAW